MGQVARRGEGEFAYRVLAGKPEGNRQLARFRCKWDNNFKVDLQEEGWDTDWIDLAQDRDKCRAVVSTVMKLRVT